MSMGFHVEPVSDSFGPGGVLYFHADTVASATDFSSETAWELLRSRDGVQMPLVSATPSGGAVSTASTGRASFDVNRFYQPGLLEAEDLWLWEALGSGVTRAKSFTLGGVDAGSSQTAELEVFLQGASESGNPVDHHVSVSLNGTPVGEAQFAGKKPYRMSLSLPASLLREGANELLVTNVADTGVSSLVFLDRFTIAHSQLSSLAGGRFAGWWAESGSVSVSASGAVSGPVRIVDVTAPVPVWLTGFEHVAGIVRFGVEAGHRYWVGSDSALMSPRVSPVQASTLKSAGNQADYLLIAPRVGTVFRMRPGEAPEDVHSFSGADGRSPQSTLLAASDGYVYGTTPFSPGALFRYHPADSVGTFYRYSMSASLLGRQRDSKEVA